MPTDTVSTPTHNDICVLPGNNGCHQHSGVSWKSILAGSIAIMSVATLLFFFGAGVGLSAMSPWAHDGMKAGEFTAMAAIWLIVVQWLSSGLGGYITGRLRCRWHGLHHHESFFRDTAHGFLAWGVAMIVTLGLIGSLAGHAVRAGNAMAVEHDAMSHEGGMHPMKTPLAYYVDQLFRTDKTDVADPATRDETSRILIKNAGADDMDAGDKAYLVQIVSARTGLAAADAEKRVNDVMAEEKSDEAKAKQVADEARKASAKIAFYTFFSMLVGAFIASAAAAMGGHHREDAWKMTNLPN